MTTTPVEAQRRYDTLTRRIAALDEDIGRELDSERKLSLEERRAEFVRDRDAVMSELTIAYRANGDMENLQRKVEDLRTAMSSDQPGKAHSIIADCVVALGVMDNKIMRLEGRVAEIENTIHPPFRVLVWKVATAFVVLFAIALFLNPGIRLIIFSSYVGIGILLEIVLLMLAIACWRLATMTARERGKQK
jgi:hypothetical protein